MITVRFHCPFMGLNGCHNGGGNGLTKAFLIKHLYDRHCNEDAQAITKHSLLSDLVIYERAKLTIKRIGIWSCGVCLKTRILRIKCRHGPDSVPPPDIRDGVVCFVLYDFTRPLVPFCSQLAHGEGLVLDQHNVFTLSLLDSLFSKGLRTVKSIPSKCRLGFSPVLKGALNKSASQLINVNARRRVSSMPSDLEELKAKHPFKSAPSLLDIPIDHHQLIASPALVLDRIKSFPRGTSCRRDSLRTQHLMDCLSGMAVAISDELVSSITIVVNLFLDGKCPLRLSACIASAPLTPLVKLGGGIHPIAFGVRVSGGGEAILHVVNRLVEDRGDETWYLDDGTIVGDTLIAGKFEGAESKVFSHLIFLGRYMLLNYWGAVSVNFGFSSDLVLKRVAKTIVLMDSVAKINDPQCELLLLQVCAGISKLHFPMRTYPPRAFESAQRLGIYSTVDALNYAFLASCLQSAALHAKLLQHVGIIAPGSTFDDALCVFNDSMKIDFLCNLNEIDSPKLMKKMADIYFTRVTKDAESTFSLFPRQMALWKSQRDDHTSDWLRAVSISRLGQTMNDKTYRCVLCYRLGILLFSVSKPFSACSRVFARDTYGDHVVSCAGIIGIKHRHNVVRDTLFDICFQSGISVGKEVDIGLDGGCAKNYTGMADFAPGRAVTDAGHRKRSKYMAKYAAIGYEFLPFSFSSLGGGRDPEADMKVLRGSRHRDVSCCSHLY
nr:ABC transporter A family member 9-like [Tanacetum cinerariifolium]